ncbi:MAG: rhodanese-like domain-containing protein [Sulfuricellaceae bacterium]|nr:rhodanese-like domain-containing protein [Sulfuricellaceae bacterium]
MPESVSDILRVAQQRAKDLQLPYEGALLPREAHFLRDHLPGVCLVDVRSRAEWDLVGVIPGSVQIEWQHYPNWALNQHFFEALKQQVDPESLVMFICRSGHRSHLAAIAATHSGFRDCYNVLEGFEGDREGTSGQRGRLGGWRMAGLPWVQS